MTSRGGEPAVISRRGGAVSVASFEQIADRARRLASGLARLGVARGEPVLLFGPNSVDWITVRLALGACGALCVGLDDVATDREVRAVLKQERCRRVFCAAKHLDVLRHPREENDLELYLLDRGDPPVEHPPHWRDLLSEQPEKLHPLDPGAAAMLLYTSGTTGTPKRFTLSSDNIAANVRALIAERLVGSGDRLLLPLPLHHAYPQIVGLFVPFASGAAVVLPESVAGPKILEALRAADATGIIGVPCLYAALASSLDSQIAARGRLVATLFKLALEGAIVLRRRFGLKVGAWLFRSIRRRLAPSLRLLVSGGARLEAGVLWRLIGLGWEVRSGYGLA
jgi:long-chain acyl-CoA synthetase